MDKETHNHHLVKVAGEGDFDELQNIIQSCKTVQQDLDRALQQSVKKCQSASEHLNCVEALIRVNADINYRDAQGVSLLMHAARLGQIQLIELLLNSGGDIDSKDYRGRSVLMYALNGYGDNEDVVNLFIERGAMINEQDSEGNSALHVAAALGLANSVQALLASYAAPNLKNRMNETPLQLALREKQVPIVKLLVEAQGARNTRAGGEEPQALLPAKTEEAEEESDTSFLSVYSEKGCVKCSSKVHLTVCAKCCEEFYRKEEEVALAWGGANAENAELRQQLDEARKQIDTQHRKIKMLRRQDASNNHLRSQCERRLMAANDKASKKSSNSLLRGYELPEYDLKEHLEADIQNFTSEICAWQSRTGPIYLELKSKLSAIVSELFPGSVLELFGSFPSATYLLRSDLDMVITNVPSPTPRTFHALHSALSHEDFISEIQDILSAMIPILKVTAHWKGITVTIDISVLDDTHRGLKCAQFMGRMLRTHPVISPLFLVLKQLFYVCDFKEPFRGGLSSYGLFLLVLAYVQSHPQAAQLPASQCLYGLMAYYAEGFMYNCPIVAKDPAGLSSFSFPARLENYLYIVDPLHPSDFNVGHNTNSQKFIYIIRIAYWHLRKVPICDSPYCTQPLSRMFYETRNSLKFFQELS